MVVYIHGCLLSWLFTSMLVYLHCPVNIASSYNGGGGYGEGLYVIYSFTMPFSTIIVGCGDDLTMSRVARVPIPYGVSASVWLPARLAFGPGQLAPNKGQLENPAPYLPRASFPGTEGSGRPLE